MGAAKSSCKAGDDDLCCRGVSPDEILDKQTPIIKNGDYEVAHGGAYEPGGATGSDADPAALRLQSNHGLPSGEVIVQSPSPKRPASGSNAIGFADSDGKAFWTSYFWSEVPELRQLSWPADSSSRRYDFKTGAFYDGQWMGAERNGMGRQVWADGSEYKGLWCRNMATGKGMFTFANGTIYVGQWRQNQAHGSGTYIHHDGSKYRGEFMDDFPDGHGQEDWPDRSTFAGRFRQGKKNGGGVYTWGDGSMAVGQWKDNQLHGCGIWTSADGQKYEGMWLASQKHGIGKYTSPDGQSYCGQYIMGDKDGYGVFRWSDGTCYKGYWVAGEPVEGTTEDKSKDKLSNSDDETTLDSRDGKS